MLPSFSSSITEADFIRLIANEEKNDACNFHSSTIYVSIGGIILKFINFTTLHDLTVK